ncbi:FtsX-like permease family protein [Saccharomonospora cyanea]|uniref:Putative ABC-type transport system involved in lysophospholipase L1 biosynthesis, permease component n=1 Tax=Saccharomonospora cyanea NA-134 TaxID=882082 RepID=H5XRH9_9PSEU|nr:ABC transporter permease [Saccharomonospora cyanea]EHR63924.1 putative ABC-type transport system involved in lysophospholipase L1 biosynthesis, permease component [Saccharomonospora cyanea NA-134]
MIAFRIALRVLRRDRRTRTSAILMGVGVAVATGLMLVLVSLPGAAQARVDRAAWQEPSAADFVGEAGEAVMSLTISEDSYDDRTITRVDVAAHGDASEIALPPGIERFPAPGEVLMSPALRELSAGLPASVLAERYPGEVVGLLGAEALTHPDQLAVLVGHTEDELGSMAMQVGGFAEAGDAWDPTLDLLAGVGVVVLLVPSLVLVASAARLTASRREQRLAALRLAGATPRQVVGMVAGENAIAAVGGALLGWAVSPLARWAASHVPWEGGTWQASDFVTSPVLTLAVVVTIPLLVLLAAVVGLWRVVRTPLGAARSERPRRPHWVRLLSLPVAAVVFFVLLRNISDALGVLLLVGALALIIASSMLIGPFVTAAIGSVFSRAWRRPSMLLAGRRLRHDPKGAYRASAGVVLAVFTGSMALTVLPSIETLAGSSSPFRDSALYVNAYDDAASVAERTNAALARYGIEERAEQISVVELALDGRSQEAYVVECESARRLLRVDPGDACDAEPGVYVTGMSEPVEDATVANFGEPGTPLAEGTPAYEIRADTDGSTMPPLIDPAVLPSGMEPTQAIVAVAATSETADVVRTALGRAGNGLEVQSVPDLLASQQAQLDDLRRVTVIGLIAAALLSGCSAAITTAGSVMDRRRTFGALMAAGTPVRVLGRALRTEAAMPALVATIGAGVTGVVVGGGLAWLFTASTPVVTPWALAPVVLGIGTALIAASVCTPALKRVSGEPLSDD